VLKRYQESTYDDPIDMTTDDPNTIAASTKKMLEQYVDTLMNLVYTMASLKCDGTELSTRDLVQLRSNTTVQLAHHDAGSVNQLVLHQIVLCVCAH
jgi:hypothetical protein